MDVRHNALYLSAPSKTPSSVTPVGHFPALGAAATALSVAFIVLLVPVAVVLYALALALGDLCEVALAGWWAGRRL